MGSCTTSAWCQRNVFPKIINKNSKFEEDKRTFARSTNKTRAVDLYKYLKWKMEFQAVVQSP